MKMRRTEIVSNDISLCSKYFVQDCVFETVLWLISVMKIIELLILLLLMVVLLLW